MQQTQTVTEYPTFTETKGTGDLPENTVSVPMKRRRGYAQHPLDEAVDSRMKVVRVKNENGTTSSYRMDVKYKVARFERYEPFVNTSKRYPFGSKRQGFDNE